ncbi:MAG TPA: ATP-binding cassette domain-containing protein [Frankiaceae bacterium]|nr:ATP-binding cassette domain-containing protein [Frankiaceae bacterium]
MLRLQNAGRHFGKQPVFSGLDLDLAAGEHLFLGGPNGSGKTTLLRCLAGTLALTSGSGTVAGWPIGSRAARARVGVCLNPEQALYPRLSGHDNLTCAARLRLPSAQVDEAVDAAQRELAITHFAGTRVQGYSSGMRARVSMARALLGEPELLLLDEPTRSLDAEGCDRLWAAIERRSVACVIASHSGADREHCERMLDISTTR